MSNPLSELEFFLAGLLLTRDPLRSVMPENWTRQRTEKLAEDLTFLFGNLPVTVEAEISLGRWFIVVTRKEAQRAANG